MLLFWMMLAGSGTMEAGSMTGVFLTHWPERLFFLSLQGVELGFIGLVFALLVYRRCSTDAAFDLGVEVGERRARRSRRPTVVNLPPAREPVNYR